MLESRIARRYLWAARKRAHTAFLSLISMLGLAVGVAVLLISLALLSGLQGQIKARLIQSSPQILIEPSGSNTIDDAPAIIAAAQRLGMTVRPLVTGIAWGANDEEKRGRPLRIRSGAARQFAYDDEIGLTRDAAAALGLNTRDVVTIVAPRTRLTPFGPVPVWKKYRIAQLLPPASDDRAAEASLNLGEAESLFGTGGRPTSIEMWGNADRAEEVQAQLAARFPRVQVKTWKEINRPLFLALRLEKVVMFATISLIIFVAALNLISSLSMLIMEKRPAVGVLRTLGATERTILTIFLEVGLLIGISGTLLGNAAGLGLAWAVNRYHLIPLPADIYFVNYLPFKLEPGDVAGVNVVAVLLSIIATWYPARMASRLDPIAAIREE
jgi:lipoprotein-releasing system permease protein